MIVENWMIVENGLICQTVGSRPLFLCVYIIGNHDSCMIIGVFGAQNDIYGGQCKTGLRRIAASSDSPFFHVHFFTIIIWRLVSRQSSERETDNKNGRFFDTLFYANSTNLILATNAAASPQPFAAVRLWGCATNASLKLDLVRAYMVGCIIYRLINLPDYRLGMRKSCVHVIGNLESIYGS